MSRKNIARKAGKPGRRNKLYLRNDQWTTDTRMDRLIEFDKESRRFNMAELQIPSKPLRSYTWRCERQYDQGPDGACVGFAMGHELAARPSEVLNLDDTFIKEEIYWGAQRVDPWSGGSYPGAAPFYEGTSVLAGARMLRELGYVEEYRWAFSTYDALYGIGHNGPAVIGINWYQGMLNPDPNGFIHPTGYVVGGHAVLVRAININKEYVTIRNSWSSAWGVDGDCYLSFQDFDKLLHESGECCFMLHRKTIPQP